MRRRDPGQGYSLKVHIIGAGLAGLSAAVRLAEQGHEVSLWEASAQAGGRCRSYRDPLLEMTLDNGNHLLLSGNEATYAYLSTVGASEGLIGPDSADLDFHDVVTNRRWTIRPNRGPAPWWLLSPQRRVPGTRAFDYAAIGALLMPGAGPRIDQAIACRGALWDRLMEPFLIGALNTRAEEGSAKLAGAVIAQSLARGGHAYQPRVAQPNLSAVFIEPALDFLRARGGEIRFASPVRALTFDDRGQVAALRIGDGEVALDKGDAVVLAAPAWIAQDLLPGLSAPTVFNAIVNGHFKIAPPPGLAPIVGVIGGEAQWIFAFEDRISVTVSAAGHLADEDREDLARRFWRDIVAVHRLPPQAPPWRIVKERRATFAATPEQDALRPPAATHSPNLFLAGDWTATGLPATVEGAIRSGVTAAKLTLNLAARAW
jgi:squalene-associated FAD-dependent desaturase